MPDNICSTCLNAGVECKHTNTPKKRGPKRNYTAQAALVGAILAEPLTYQIPDDSTNLREMLVDICLYARSLEKDLSRLRRATISNTSSNQPPPSPDITQASTSDSLPYVPDVFDDDSDDVDTNTIYENFKHLSLYDSRPRHHYGSSSNFVLAQTILELDFKHNDDLHLLLKRFERPLFWIIYPWQREISVIAHKPPLVFPDADHLHELISVYFTDFDPFLPILHRKTFEQGVKEGLHLRDQCFGKVVLAVCAIASRRSNDPRNMIPGAPWNIRWAGLTSSRLTWLK
jgi:hypothetical protein